MPALHEAREAPRRRCPVGREPNSLPSGLPSRILTGNMDGEDYGRETMDWKHLLAYITGTIDQELLLRNAYLVTANRILRNQLKGRSRLSDGERKALAEIG